MCHNMVKLKMACFAVLWDRKFHNDTNGFIPFFVIGHSDTQDTRICAGTCFLIWLTDRRSPKDSHNYFHVRWVAIYKMDALGHSGLAVWESPLPLWKPEGGEYCWKWCGPLNHHIHERPSIQDIFVGYLHKKINFQFGKPLESWCVSFISTSII